MDAIISDTSSRITNHPRSALAGAGNASKRVMLLRSSL
jgi:hypothetical protein